MTAPTSSWRCPWCQGDCRYWGLETCVFRPRQFPNKRWLIPMIAGPCPRCLRDGKRVNCCAHQLADARGYIFASFEVVDGRVTELP